MATVSLSTAVTEPKRLDRLWTSMAMLTGADLDVGGHAGLELWSGFPSPTFAAKTEA
jgi:hypothetical protein